MSIPEMILEGIRELPPEKQHEVLGFIESLKGSGQPAKRGWEGLRADMDFDITEEEIA